MGFEALLEALERDTDARVARIRAEADARIAELTADPGPLPLPPPAPPPGPPAEIDAQREVLLARARVLDRVLAVARELLPDEPVDVDRARALVDGPATLGEDGQLHADDGSMTVDCRWTAQLEAAFPGLQRGVLDQLEGAS